MQHGDLTLRELASALGERTPASAAAVTAALGASLVELAARLAENGRVGGEAVRLRDLLLSLADEDAAAAAEFARTRSDDAWSRTVDVPLQLVETAAAVVRLGTRLEREASSRLAGDASAAVELARAAVRVGARLVEANLDGRPDRRANRVRELIAAGAG